MPLSEEFEKKSEDVVSQLHALVDSKQPWRADLQEALSNADFTPQQEQAIRDAASDNTFQTIGDDAMNDFATRVTHAFQDSLANIAMTLEMATMMGEEESTLNNLVQIKSVIQDLSHNYPLMLGDDLPDSVQDILDKYNNDVIPRVNEMIDELSRSTEIAPESATLSTRYQHIYALPEDAFPQEVAFE